MEVEANVRSAMFVSRNLNLWTSLVELERVSVMKWFKRPVKSVIAEMSQGFGDGRLREAEILTSIANYAKNSFDARISN